MREARPGPKRESGPRVWPRRPASQVSGQSWGSRLEAVLPRAPSSRSSVYDSSPARKGRWPGPDRSVSAPPSLAELLRDTAPCDPSRARPRLPSSSSNPGPHSRRRQLPGRPHHGSAGAELKFSAGPRSAPQLREVASRSPLEAAPPNLKASPICISGLGRGHEDPRPNVSDVSNQDQRPAGILSPEVLTAPTPMPVPDSLPREPCGGLQTLPVLESQHSHRAQWLAYHDNWQICFVSRNLFAICQLSQDRSPEAGSRPGPYLLPEARLLRN